MTPNKRENIMCDAVLDSVFGRTVETVMAEASAWAVDSVARWHLNSISDRLRRYRCNLSHLNADEQALYGGPNMRGPAIDDLIAESAWHRERGAQRAWEDAA